MKYPKKINVVGTSGSGKSTFSQQLAEVLDCSYIEMDRLHWKPKWEESSTQELIEKLQSRLTGDRWVLDGNYGKTIPIKWADVDTVIWLDYSFSVTLFRAIKRAIKRSLSGREIWPGTGNVETFSKLLFSKESVVLWTIVTYHQNRRKYRALMAEERFTSIEFIVLRNTKQAQRYIQAMKTP